MVLEHWQTMLIGFLIAVIILAPWIRKVWIEEKQVKWFHSLSLSEQTKIVGYTTSDEVLKEHIKYYYNQMMRK